MQVELSDEDLTLILTALYDHDEVLSQTADRVGLVQLDKLINRLEGLEEVHDAK